MTTNNEFDISSSSNGVLGAPSWEILPSDDIIDTGHVLKIDSSNNDNSFGNDNVTDHSEESDNDEIEWVDGSIVREDDTIVINLPSYTLISGDEVPLPVALWGEKNFISENFVFGTGMWLEEIQDEAYMKHKYSSNSHYLYEPSQELTNIVNDSMKIIVDVVEKLYERRYSEMVLKEIFIRLKLEKDYTTEMAASHLRQGLEVARNGFIDWSRVRSQICRKRKRN